MYVSRVAAADLDAAVRGYLTHKGFVQSCQSCIEDRKSFLKDPVTFDKLQDPMFWVDRLWSRSTIERMIEVARSKEAKLYQNVFHASLQKSDRKYFTLQTRTCASY